MSTHDPYSSPQQEQQPGHREPENQQQQPYTSQGAPSYTGPQQPGPYGGYQGGPGHPGQQYQQQGQPYGGGYAGQGGPGYQGQQQQPGPYGHPQQGYGYQNTPVRPGSQPGVPVGFVDAIKRFYAKYAQFSGRASRSEYWWVALYLGIVYFVLSLLMAADTNAFGETGAFGSLIALLLGIFALGHLVPTIAIGVRRLHDVNMSGWLYLLVLIPYLGGLVLLVFMVLAPKSEGARFDR
ncbi:DUF805 domain-containing protein [Kocuria sp. CH-021]|uniref:DUF805 domain-containing protein n=1 Tax=Kocuria sp. CH-021 TaxID=3406735 RepID=UPI003C77A89E